MKAFNFRPNDNIKQANLNEAALRHGSLEIARLVAGAPFILSGLSRLINSSSN